jgi:bifunctional non-homologous end joining protein LigD
MALREYQRKRDFERTPEPRGKVKARKSGAGGRFVIQKHAATRLHYDFRLELDGVLKSWAVPKGPSLDPKERRLAVEVEDHPLEYGSFEGVIPKGEYGGGTVVLWDDGRWKPDGDAHAGLREGKLKFELRGEKLQGHWMLVRIHEKAGESRDGGKPNWLLIKENDPEARPLAEGDVLEERPESVSSGRTLEEVADQRDRVWSSKKKEKKGKKTRKGEALEIPAPQLATLVTEPPQGEGWFHEMKLDGYRILAHWDGEEARLVTRNGLDWTARFPSVAQALGKLDRPALLDGEVVALTPEGIPSFQALQNVLQADHKLRKASTLVYYVFDLLYLDEEDWRSKPLRERKEALADLLPDSAVLKFSDHLEGRGEEFFRSACKMGLEGVISKRAASRYHSGRNRDWLKIKCSRRQEAIVGGFTEPSGTRSDLGALLLGVMENGKLRYAGKVGTGFNAATLRELRGRLDRLERKTSPFDPAPRRAEVGGKAHWVEPKLVAEVRFAEWTEDGRMRQAAFQGLREDKSSREVSREVAAAPPPPKSSSEAPSGITLTHPDRVLYPEQGITKLDLARYYEAVAEWILPHVAGRPLTLVRCPEGQAKQCFYQKHPLQQAKPPLHTVPIREDDGGEEPYLYIEDLPGLITVVQLGVLELHPWGSRVKDVEKPDRLIFDLDPDPKIPWAKLVAAAREVHDGLQELGLESWVKTTGGKGLHVCVPLTGDLTWDDLRAFARAFAEVMVQRSPERYLSKASKAARAGKIFVDWLRNGRGATAVAAYSTRAREGATVATPLTWDELGRAKPAKFTVETIPQRLKKLKSDPWEEFFTVKQRLPKIDS